VANVAQQNIGINDAGVMAAAATIILRDNASSSGVAAAA